MSSSNQCEQVQYVLSVQDTGAGIALPRSLEQHLHICGECAAFRTGLQGLEARLEVWEAPAIPRDLKGRIAARLSAEPAAPTARTPFRLRPRSVPAGRKKESRIMLKRLSWEAAAIAMVAMGVLSLRSESVEAIFKRMNEATKKVRTAHIVMKAEGPSGKLKNAEIWYKEGNWRQEEQGTVVLYLGKEVWKNGVSVAPTSVPSMPASPIFFALKADDGLKTTTQLLGNQRIGSRTVHRILVNQIPKAGSASRPSKPTYRFLLSIDSATGLMVHLEGGDLRGGQFVTQMTADLDYNEKLPDSLFDPKLTEKKPGEETPDPEPTAPSVTDGRQRNVEVDDARLGIERVLGLNRVQKEQYAALIRQATLEATAIENDTRLSAEEKVARHLADRKVSDAQLRQLLTPAQRTKLDAYLRNEKAGSGR